MDKDYIEVFDKLKSEYEELNDKLIDLTDKIAFHTKEKSNFETEKGNILWVMNCLESQLLELFRKGKV